MQKLTTIPPSDRLLYISIFCLGCCIVLCSITGYKLTKKDQPGLPQTSYQLNVTNDSLYLLDGDRKVGVVSWEEKQGLNKLIEKDNE